MLKLMRICMAVVAVSVVTFSSAYGAIIVNDWQVNLAALEPEEFAVGTAPALVTGIDFITFNATTHSLLSTDVNGNGLPDVGDVYTVNILGDVTSFRSTPNTNIPVAGLGSTWQLNFNGTVEVEVTGISGTFNEIVSFAHLPGGELDFFIDGPVGGFTPAGTSEASFSDGTLIATMEDLGILGGSLNFLTFDGSDDATYQLISAPISGLLLDSGGMDLTTAPGQTLLAFVDSNFDMDFDNQNTFSTDGVPAWTTAAPTIPLTGAGPGSFDEFFSSEDGSVRLGLEVIPEATSVLIWGALALIGSCLFARTRYVPAV